MCLVREAVSEFNNHKEAKITQNCQVLRTEAHKARHDLDVDALIALPVI